LRLIRGLYLAFSDASVRALLGLTVTLILGASAFYHYVEGWGWLDAIYFSVITLSTVGYGDLYPATAAGKIFTIIYILSGIGIFLAAATVLAEKVIRQATTAEPGNQDHRP
jgi:voltage-gated potassium channel